MVYSRRVPGRVTDVHKILGHDLMFSYLPASRCRGPGSIPDQSMWNSCWTKYQRFSEYFSFPCQYHSIIAP